MKNKEFFKKDANQEIKKEKTIEDKELELINFLENISKKIRELGIPLKKDCRIDIQGFKNIYPEEEILKDEQEVARLEKEFIKDEEKRKESLKWKMSPEDFLELKDKIRTGEKLELLKTALFSKFLKENFIVVRTSRYDDIKNNVDNLILEKNTGSLICALDEVGNISGPLFEEKKWQVLKRNLKEGGKVKYGFKLIEGKIKLCQVDNIPIFLIALSTRHIEEGIQNFNSSFDEFSDYENKLFKFWVLSLKSQIAALRLEKRIQSLIRERLIQFEEVINKFDILLK